MGMYTGPFLEKYSEKESPDRQKEVTQNAVFPTTFVRRCLKSYSYNNCCVLTAACGRNDKFLLFVLYEWQLKNYIYRNCLLPV